MSAPPRDPRIAVCPGSYDPVTLGHVDVIERTSTIFERVIVAVVREPRHKVMTFETQERVSLLEDAVSHLGNVAIEPFSELVVEFAQRASGRGDCQGAPGDLRLRVGVPDEPSQPKPRS